jgi:exonuclease III
MSKQVFLDNYFQGVSYKVNKEVVRILNWNIRNPSFLRATKQCRYIEHLRPHIILLTELRSGSGLKYFEQRLSYLGYQLFYEYPGDDYFVLIASIYEASEIPMKTDFMPHRIKGIVTRGDIEGTFIGIYVPSRGPKERRNVNKKMFQESVMRFLDALKEKRGVKNTIIGGDLNVIDPSHIPKYSIFGEWEYDFYNKFIEIGMKDAFKLVNTQQDYSWFGREGDGYRFDHFFVSEDLKEKVIKCYYDHSVREKRLSDHSSMILELKL